MIGTLHIVLAMKPLDGTFAENALKHGVAGLNIDGSRISGLKGDGVWGTSNATVNRNRKFNASPEMGDYRSEQHAAGRFPANVLLGHCEKCKRVGMKKETVEAWECQEGCPVKAMDEQSGIRKTTWVSSSHKNNRRGDFLGELGHPGNQGFNDTGGASRFFKQVSEFKEAQ